MKELACRALELFAGSLLCLWLIAPGQSEDPFALFEAFARTAILVGLYHVLSLYFVSCVALGYFWRRQDPLKQAGVMAMVFAIHAVYFVDRASAWEETAVFSAFAIGTGLVFAVIALVEIRLNRRKGHG